MANYYYKLTVGNHTIEVGFNHHHELMEYIRMLEMDGAAITTNAVPCSHPLAEVYVDNEEDEAQKWIVGAYHLLSKNKVAKKFLSVDPKTKKWTWTKDRKMAKAFSESEDAEDYGFAPPIPLDKNYRTVILEL